MTPVKSWGAHSARAPLAPLAIERRQPGEFDVRFDILYCGVCHSDVHQVRGEWGGRNFPMVPGHEIVGRVTAVGSKVSRFKAGDSVAVGCLVNSCRECENCKDGLEQYCEKGAVPTYNGFERDGKTPTYGGYSRAMVVDEAFVLKMPTNLAPEAVAPLLCAGITTYSPLRHWRITKGHKVGVLGLGGLGHMAVKFAAAFGAEVTMLSTSPAKEADAKRLGANHFALTTNKEAMRKYKGYFDFIIDTVSAPHDFDFFLRLLRTSGVHILVGLPPDAFSLNAFNIVGNRRSVAGSMIGGLPETQEMLDFCSAHSIVSDVEVININYINEAYDRMLKGDVRYRFVIDMSTLV